MNTVTIMSDVHVDEKDYGDFHCTESVDKFRQIMSETKGSRFYISLGDVVNSLPNGSLNNYYDAVSVMKEAGNYTIDNIIDSNCILLHRNNYTKL